MLMGMWSSRNSHSWPVEKQNGAATLESSGPVRSGCYNQVPQTGGWLINNRYLHHTVLETRSPRSGYQHGQVLVRTLFWGSDCQLLIVTSHGERREGKQALSQGSYKATSRILKSSTHLPSSYPNYLPKLSQYHHTGKGGRGSASTHEFW